MLAYDFRRVSSFHRGSRNISGQRVSISDKRMTEAVRLMLIEENQISAKPRPLCVGFVKHLLSKENRLMGL